MIHTSRTVTVGKMESVINEPIMLYRGDREVEIEFNIVGSKFMFSNGGNVIKSTNATNGQLVINTPTGENMFSEVTECNDGKVICVITKEMIDELAEVGFYSFQIRLFDESQVSRVTIPPVYQGIEIRNPIAAEDETDLVDIGLVDFSVVRKDNYENVVTFLPNGDYNKTLWEEHDVISKDRLNKVEDALYEINKGTEGLYPTLQNQYDEFSAKVNNDVKAYKEEMEDEVEQFERDMTQAFGEFKVDINEEMINTIILNKGFVNVIDFGAKGDGITDDTYSIKNAMEYAIQNDYKKVFFNKGKYLINSALSLRGNLEYIGNDTEIILNKETSYLTIKEDDFVIDNITVDANNCTMRALYINGSKNFTVRNSTFKNGTKYGLNVEKAHNASFENCKFEESGRRDFMSSSLAINGSNIKIFNCDASENSKGNGFMIYSTSEYISNNITLLNCIAKQNYQHGFVSNTLGLPGDKSKDILYNNCISTCNGYENEVYSGFAIHYADFVNVINCVADENKEHGIVLMDGDNIVISNCTFKNNGMCGVRLQADWIRSQDKYSGVKKTTISNCLINYNGTRNDKSSRYHLYNGVLIEGNCHYISLFNNIMSSNNGGSVYVKTVDGYSDCTNIYVEDNIFLANIYDDFYKNVATTSLFGANYIGGKKVEIRESDDLRRKFTGKRVALNTLGAEITNFKPEDGFIYYATGSDNIVIESLSTEIENGLEFYLYLASKGGGSITIKHGTGIALQGDTLIISKDNNNNETLIKFMKPEGTNVRRID